MAPAGTDAGDGRTFSWPAPPSRGRTAAIVALSAAILLSLLARLPNLRGDLTDNDSWRQCDTATVAHHFVAEPRLFYPRINWGAPGRGYVESELQLYPFAVSLLYRVFAEDPLVGRLLSVFLSAISCVVLYRIARRYLGAPCALVGVLFFSIAPLFFRFSRAFMPEATVVLFYLLTLAWFLRYLDDGRWRSILLSAGAFAVAILVKPTCIHLGLVLMILSARKSSWRTWFTPKLLAFAAIAVAPAAIYAVHAAKLHFIYGNTFGTITGGDPKWGGPRWWFSPRFYWGLARTDIGGAGGYAAGALACIGLLARRRGNWRALVLAWAGTLFAYYLIVARYADFAPQYHVYAMPLLALCAGAGVETLVRVRRGAWAALLGLGLVAFAGYRDRQMTVYRDDLLLDAGDALAAVSRPGDFVIVLSHDPAIDAGVDNNYQEPDVFFYADRSGQSLARDRQTPAGLAKALACGARWFVNFPALNDKASPDFKAYLDAHMTRVLKADPPGAPRFEIYRLRPPTQPTSKPGSSN